MCICLNYLYLYALFSRLIIAMHLSILLGIGELSSKFEEFLAVRSQFDSDHGIDFYAPTCCQSVTFVRLLFAFYCPLFFTKKIINYVVFFHRHHVYAARLMDLRN